MCKETEAAVEESQSSEMSFACGASGDLVTGTEQNVIAFGLHLNLF